MQLISDDALTNGIARHIRQFLISYLLEFPVSEAMRSSVGLNDRQKKILFRAWHRGMREMDFMLGTFANEAIADMSEEELNDFEDLMRLPDPDTYKWLSGMREIPNNWDKPIVHRIRQFHLS